ncbi:MAG: DNA gyrase subunit A [Candidatus Bilamarchaeaceae archaeon]
MEKILDETIEKDLQESYLDYAMSVIVGRALPDVRDGLKPVHRRILYTMGEMGNSHEKPYRKSARVVGDVLGKYHPHGDAAIYETIVRMAQEFSLRYTLVDGQGNFGSIDGDSAAAMRYTEIRMSKVAGEILADIEKETVDFVPNFDGTLKEPVVLPSRIPNLLVNGSAGIAVGMATNIPPHNLTEVVDALIRMIDGADEEEVLSVVKGPDFPTGGTILGRGGIRNAYKTGKGIIRMRGKADVREGKGKRTKIVITEIPYQVNKSTLIETIAEAVKNKKIEGISDIKDLSAKDEIEVQVELKQGANPEIVLNQIYAHSPMETTFGIINLVLVKNQPKWLPLYGILSEFVAFRKEIVTKRSQFELRQAQDRAHILEGLKIALEKIDDVVAFLRKTKEVVEARSGLMSRFSLSEKQANAILDMKLQRIVGLEQDKIENEYAELKKTITWLNEVLGDDKKLMDVVKKELLEVKEKYGDSRKTDITDAEDDIEVEDLIPNNDVAVIITQKGYVKRIGVEEYRTQRRGGKGVISAETREEDTVKEVMITKNKNHMLFFTDKGRVHWLKAYRIPEGSRYSTGRTLVNLLDLKDEKVSSWISVEAFSETESLVMVTKNGIVKRTSLGNFANPRKGGIIAITLKEGDQLIDVLRTSGKDQVFIATKDGFAIRFDENDAREIGRTGQGVIGIRLRESDAVVSATLCRKGTVLSVSENGYGKRTSFEEYRGQNRGGLGIINIKTEGRNGAVIGAKAVDDTDEIILLSTKGQAIRIPASGISVIGRNTQGVRLMRLQEEEGETVAAFDVMKAGENTGLAEGEAEAGPENREEEEKK